MGEVVAEFDRLARIKRLALQMERDVRYQTKPFLTMLVIVSILLVGGVWLWLVRFQSPAFHIVMLGGRNSANGFGVSGGNVVAVAGRPSCAEPSPSRVHRRGLPT